MDIIVVEEFKNKWRIDMKKLLLALTALMIVGCNMTMDSLDVVNGTKYVVTSKSKRDYGYLYSLIKIGDTGDTWYDYDYSYKATEDFNVGDTLILTISLQRTQTEGIGRIGN